MKLTRSQYEALIARPNMLAANRGQQQGAKLECAAGAGALAAEEGEAGDTAQFLVRVTSHRKRLLDEDNLGIKYHVDTLRYAGLLPGDSPATTHIEARQRKVAKGEPEKTVIEMFYFGQPQTQNPL